MNRFYLYLRGVDGFYRFIIATELSKPTYSNKHVRDNFRIESKSLSHDQLVIPLDT